MKHVALGLLAGLANGLIIKDQWDPLAQPGYSRLCQVGEVSLYGNGDGKRYMMFGTDESAIQTEIDCIAPQPCVNAADCNCPCKYNSGKGLQFDSFRLMDSNVQDICQSSSPSKVLLISLGGGDFTQHLMYACPNMAVTAVELSKDVITAAMNGLGVKQTSEQFPGRLQVINNDALAAIASQPGENYDAVLVDCMGKGGVIPDSCQSHDFVLQVTRVMKQDAHFLQLMWSRSYGADRVEGDYKRSLMLYKDIFNSKLEVLPVPGQDIVKILKMTK